MQIRFSGAFGRGCAPGLITPHLPLVARAKPRIIKQRRKKESFFRRVCNREKIYFFFLAGAFFFAAFLAGAFFLAAFLAGAFFFAGAFFLAAFFAGAFFLAVATSLTSFQVFFETTSFSFITVKRKTLCASYACTQLFSIPFFFMTYVCQSSHRRTTFIDMRHPNHSSSHSADVVRQRSDRIIPFL